MKRRSGSHASRRRPRQQEFAFTNWGGKRRGAGRKPKGERAGVSHAKRAKLVARFPVLVTLRLCEGLRSLRDDDSHALLKAAFAAGSSAVFRVIEYSVQSTHLHLVAEAQDERALARGMTGLAVRVARGLNILWRRVGRVFQDRYHSRILRTPKAVRVALIYVLQNARKHGAWVAKRPDAYSSAPTFDGWRRGTKVAESSGRFLARARTWLLSIGWRRHGLLDPLEVPAGCAAGCAAREVAQKSTRPGRSLRETKRSKLASSSSTGCSRNRRSRQRPQTGTSPRRSSGTRLAAPQAAHGICTTTGMPELEDTARPSPVKPAERLGRGREDGRRSGAGWLLRGRDRRARRERRPGRRRGGPVTGGTYAQGHIAGTPGAADARLP